MADWSIEYELVDKPTNREQNINRTARFTSSKWRRDEFPSRNVEYIEIQRTVPAGEISKYKKFIGKNTEEILESRIGEATERYASAVLDKDISNYRSVSLSSDPSNKLFVGASRGSNYSQFHFGAGEASIISTIDRIENSPENSLVLIEEIENGLHPIAVRLFVQYLQSAARRKRLQIIFTTHSQEAIDEMPPEGVWASINSNTWNGKLSIDSLRAITGQSPDERVVFVEDDFVQEWVKNAIGRYAPELHETTKVYKAGGYPNVLRVTSYHNNNPTIKIPAIALVDGDIYDPAANERLPEYAEFLGGGVPEAVVFNYIFENRIELSGVIRQRCLLSAFDEQRIIDAIEGVRNSACDPHIIYERIGERLSFASSLYIRSGMIDLFNERNPDFWRETVEFVGRDRVPAEAA